MPTTPLLMSFRDWLAQRRREWTLSAPFDWRITIACGVGALLLFPLVRLLPVAGWDWGVYFARGDLAQYPPWSGLVLAPLTILPWREGLALVNGMTLCAVAFATRREADGQRPLPRFLAPLLALLSPPTLMLLWQGNIDGLVQFGIVSFPFGLVVALIKPHLAIWAVAARRSWVIAALAFLLISLVIWAGWPVDLFATLPARNAHPMAMGWQNLSPVLLIIGLAMLPFTRADPLHLMCVGAFLTPYLLPQHLLLLLPSLGRVQGTRRLLLWGMAWTTALPAMFMSWGLYAAYLFPLVAWWLLLPPRRHMPHGGAMSSRVDR